MQTINYRLILKLPNSVVLLFFRLVSINLFFSNFLKQTALSTIAQSGVSELASALPSQDLIKINLALSVNTIVHTIHIEVVLEVQSGMSERLKNWGEGTLCVEIGFTQTFPRNQDATVKLKSELISIKFQQFFNIQVDFSRTNNSIDM